MTSTAIYLRVSTEEQARDGFGLDAQLDQCEAMAKVKGWDITHVLRDDGISGTKDESERPGLAELVQLVDTRAIDAVIIAALDRIGRSTRLILRIVDTVGAAGVDLVSCKESLDTSTATGRFVLRMFASLAELARDDIVERTTAGRNARGRKDGERGGRVPMGYRREMVDGKATGRILIDEETAPLVQDIFSMRDAGATLQEIADDLNGRGIDTRRGGTWTPSSVRYVLGNGEKYRGGRRWKSSEYWPVLLD